MTFIDLYNVVLGTSYSQYEDIPFAVDHVQFKKGTVITSYGDVEESVYFINKGIVEICIKGYADEKVIDFFFANDMMCGFTSFLTQHPTDVQVLSLTDIEMERISYSDLMKAYNTSFEANKFGRMMTEQAYIRKATREKNLLTKTAEEIYAEMFHTHAQYVTQIPVNKIAKYLGIHPESLSRIRKKMNS